MVKFNALFKYFWRQHFRFSKYKADGTKNKTWIAFIFVGIYFAFLLGTFAVMLYMLGKLCAEQNLFKAEDVIALLYTLGQFSVLFFGISTIINTIYTNNDAAQLLPLPISGGRIFAARLVLVYVQEILFAAASILFFVMPFGMGYGLGVGFYLGLLPIMLILPILPLTIGCLLAIPISYLITLLKGKGFWSLLFYLLLFGGLIALFYVFIGKFMMFTQTEESAQLLQDILESFSKAGNNLYPNIWIGKAIVSGQIGEVLINIALFLATNGALFVLMLLIAGAWYKKTILRQLENPDAGSLTKSDFKSQGKLKALLSADFKNILRDNKLGLFCLFGLVISPVVMGFMAFVYGRMPIDASESLPVNLGDYLFFFLIFLVVGSNVMATGAISRDRHLFYIYKYMPIDGKTYSDVKVIAALIVNAVIIFLSLAVITAFGVTSILQALNMFIVLTLIAYANTNMQIIIDFKNPRLKWNNIQEGLKNNSSALWTILIAIISVTVYALLLIGGLSLDPTTHFFYILAWVIIYVITLVYAFITQYLLTKKSKKYMETIE